MRRQIKSDEGEEAKIQLLGEEETNSKGVTERGTEETSYRLMEWNGTKEAVPNVHISFLCKRWF